MLKYRLIFLPLLFVKCLGAQESINVRPLTDNILMLHIDEGFVQHAVLGEPRPQATAFVNPVNISLANQVSQYNLSSTTDPSYTVARSPSTINRKTKPTDFVPLCEEFQNQPFFGVIGCNNTTQDHALEHWVYLSLPIAMKSNETYTLSINTGVIGQQRDIEFVFDEQEIRSDAIHVNNISYSTAAELKYGYVYHWMGDAGSLDLSGYNNNTFGILDVSSGAVVYTGNLEFRKSEFTQESFRGDTGETPNNNFLGAEVYECDFSDFNVPGQYKLFVEGIGSSYPFNISCNSTRLPFEMVMKSIYYNRSGVHLDHPFTEDPRPAPHNPALTPRFAGKLKYSSTTICEVTNSDASIDDKPLWDSGIIGDLDAWGWYQDAGDWDGYPSHYKVPVQLLFTYEHFPNNFVDGQLATTENDNGLPDILDEARWLIRYYKRIKDETESKGWTTGGVPGGRVFGDLWGEDLGDDDIIRGSWQDNDRIWVASGEDVVTSLNYAGIAAHFAYILEQGQFSDPENIDWEAEAINAYQWAIQSYDVNGVCHEYSHVWARNYAAAALFRLTGVSSYDTDFQTTWTATGQEAFDVLQGEPAYGPYVYAFTDRAKMGTIDDSIKIAMEFTADFYLIWNIDERSCRWGGNPFFPMLSGHPTTPYVFEGLMGYNLIKDTDPNKAADYLKYLYTTVDYFLGTNPLQMTWVSGLGEKTPYGLLHLDSWASGDGFSPKSGIVPYGPWKRDEPTIITSSHHHWPFQWVYPQIDVWPGHERWFEQRYAALGPEYTIHQNSVTAAAIYGALSGEYGCSMTSGDTHIGVSSSTIEVFSDPDDEFFIIRGILPDYELSLLDIDGQILWDMPNESQEIVINTNNLGTGMYFIRVAHSSIGQLFLEKFIKMVE